MKDITANGINSTYGTSNGIVLFGDGKMSQRYFKRHIYANEMRSKKQRTR